MGYPTTRICPSCKSSVQKSKRNGWPVMTPTLEVKKRLRRKKANDRRGEVPAPDRLPPFDDLAEMAVIGAIVSSNGSCVPQCQLLITVEHFYSLIHRTIFEQALVLFERDHSLD